MSCETCQFCEKFSASGRTSGRTQPKYEGKVKYGVRHYAHFECFLAAKGLDGLMKLPVWKARQFPYLLIKEYGFEKELKAAGV